MSARSRVSCLVPSLPYIYLIYVLICRELKKESYGTDLLHAIGFVYVSKAKQHLATNQTFMGVGGWIHNVQGKYHVFSETCVSLNSYNLIIF